MVAEYTQELILLLPAGKSNSICHNVKLSTKNTPLQHGTPAKWPLLNVLDHLAHYGRQMEKPLCSASLEQFSYAAHLK